MRSRKRILGLSGCIALVGLLISGLILTLRPMLSPLDRAQAIASTTRWVSGRDGVPLYFWSGANDLTYISEGADRRYHLFRHAGSAGGNHPDTENAAVEIRGGREAGELSPDGNWFVEWAFTKNRQRFPTFVSLDGRQRHEGQATPGHLGVWSPDSAFMISWTWNSGADLYRFDPTNGVPQKAMASGVKHFAGPQCIDSSGHLVGFEDGDVFVNVTLGGARGVASRSYPTAKLLRIDLNAPTNRLEQWTVQVPETTDGGRCLVAPSCDRILWIVYGDNTPPLLRRLRSLVPGYRPSNNMGYRWFVSDLRGKNLHEVGSFLFSPDKFKTAEAPLYSMPRWLPDSRHISFIYKDTLYVRPTE